MNTLLQDLCKVADNVTQVFFSYKTIFFHQITTTDDAISVAKFFSHVTDINRFL